MTPSPAFDEDLPDSPEGEDAWTSERATFPTCAGVADSAARESGVVAGLGVAAMVSTSSWATTH